MKKQIGRYQLIKKLGKGGMGSVYKAVVPVVDQIVALKVLDPFEAMVDVYGPDKLKEIFTYEAQTMALLRHPAMVQVWDYNEDEKGRPFIVMQYLCNNLGEMIGESFEMEKTSRVIMPEKVIDYGLQLLEGLSYLHYHDIVHRDIKPFNILITDDDSLKICDFGMALRKGVSFAGLPNMQIGSPFYTAPEQVRDPAAVDGRSDLYSAAVLLYRMLTGELPHKNNPSLADTNYLYGESWDRFFTKALNHRPDDRFQLADEMYEQIDNGLRKLIVERKQEEQQAVKSLQVLSQTGTKEILRSAAIKVEKKSACKRFNLNKLYQPKVNSAPILKHKNHLVHDIKHNLLWQESGSRYPVSWNRAQHYVDNLNKLHSAGHNQWRLPTVDELVSLMSVVSLPTLGDFVFFNKKISRLWSCDSCKHQERWFVNFEMGYVGQQDKYCYNYVKAVCSV